MGGAIGEGNVTPEIRTLSSARSAIVSSTKLTCSMVVMSFKLMNVAPERSIDDVRVKPPCWVSLCEMVRFVLDSAVQLILPFDRHSDGALDAALDEVHERFGPTAVTRAVLLGRDPGLTVPLLPD